jgi:hypothetical protein
MINLRSSWLALLLVSPLGLAGCHDLGQPDQCQPRSCAAVAKSCGTVPDGCGGLLDCGGCAAGETCGAGAANVCGTGICMPKTCAAQGFDCGSASDGCGGLLDCGSSCPAGQSCGAGAANVCGIACNMSCPAGFSCDAKRGVCAGGKLSQLVLDETTYRISGKITVMGALPTSNGFCADPANADAEVARVSFTDVARGLVASATVPCSRADFGFATLLPAGTWRIQVGIGRDTGRAGVNLLPLSYIAREALVVNGPVADLVLDEVAYPVSGKITVGGAPPTRNSYCDAPTHAGHPIANLMFAEANSGNIVIRTLSCSSVALAFSTLLPAGSWRVRINTDDFADEAGLNLLPFLYEARNPVVVQGPTSDVVIDEVGVPVSGKITVGGAAPTRNQFCDQPGNADKELAQIHFFERSTSSLVSASIPCRSVDASFSTTLSTGIWEITVERRSDAASAGSNLLPFDYKPAELLVVDGPRANLVIDEQGYPVSGKVTVGGATPTRNDFCDRPGNADVVVARVELAEVNRNLYAHVPIACSSRETRFATVLAKGTWRVSVSPESETRLAGLNLLPFAYVAAEPLVVNGPLGDVVVDEPTTGGFPVSGKITVRGAAPTRGAFCDRPENADVTAAEIEFTEPARFYTRTVTLPCRNRDLSFSTVLPPGTWRVRVSATGRLIGSGLLPFAYVVREALVVDKPIDKLMLDEVSYPVGGKITIGGATPVLNDYCRQGHDFDPLAEIDFHEPARGYYSSAKIACRDRELRFMTELPPGTWTIWVRPGQYAANAGLGLASYPYRVVDRLQVP